MRISLALTARQDDSLLQAAKVMSYALSNRQKRVRVEATVLEENTCVCIVLSK